MFNILDAQNKLILSNKRLVNLINTGYPKRLVNLINTGYPHRAYAPRESFSFEASYNTFLRLNLCILTSN